MKYKDIRDLYSLRETQIIFSVFANVDHMALHEGGHSIYHLYSTQKLERIVCRQKGYFK